MRPISAAPYAVVTEEGERRFAAARRTHLAGVRRGFLERFSDAELDTLADMWERVRPGADRRASADRR